MKEAVCVSGHSTGAVGDGLAQAAPGIESRQLGDLAAVGVYVGGRVGFDQILTVRFDIDGGRGRDEGQLRRDFNRKRASDGDILNEGRKAGSGDFQMVGIGRNVEQPEIALRGRRSGCIR